MIENANASRNPGEFFDVKRYVGVASVNILAINPNNEKLRKYGWNIPADADEPTYIVNRKDQNGNDVKAARICFLVQIQDLDEKPIIMLNFFVQTGMMVSKDNLKCKIIDQYGRTAWATKEEIKSGSIPIYKTGNAANICFPYKPCHRGEEELINFLFKYLNITPFNFFDGASNAWKQSVNPGKLTIDDWDALCSANVKEIAGYVALQPENRVKVILGLHINDENKSYQSFLSDGYIGNAATIGTDGEYITAKKLITRFYESHDADHYLYEAKPVHEWKPVATEVKEKPTTMFDDQGNFIADEPSANNPFDNDLPFA